MLQVSRTRVYRPRVMQQDLLAKLMELEYSGQRMSRVDIAMGRQEDTTRTTTMPGKCTDGKFDQNLCSEWCNHNEVWPGCGDIELSGADPRNTDLIDFKCSCAGCSGCAGAPGMSGTTLTT